MDTPAIPPPPGEISDFNAANPIYKWNVLTQAVFLTATTVLVSIRVYAKVRIMSSKRLTVDDYTCVLAWLMFLGYGILTSIQGAWYDGGQHAWNMNKEQFHNNLWLINVTQIVYGPQICLTKVSILLLYASIFAPRRRTLLWWTIYLSIWGIVLFYISTTIVKVLQCSPREKIWVPSTPGSCINISALLIVAGSFNLATDIFLMVLPISSIWRLKLRLRQRIALTGVFLVGSIAPITTAVRLAVSIEYTSDPDVTFHIYGLLLWTCAEIGIGISCACLPIVPAFFRHFFPKTRASHASLTWNDSSSGGVQRPNKGASSHARSLGVSRASAYIELGDAVHVHVHTEPPAIPGQMGSSVTSDQTFEEVPVRGIRKTTRISQQYDH